MIKLADGKKNPDAVAAVAIVSGKGEAKAPATNKRALHLYMDDHKDDEIAVTELPSTQQDEDASQSNLGKSAGFARSHALAEKFRNEPEHVQQEYQARAEADRKRYEEELEEYKLQDIEEVMLGSTGGLITRLQTGGIPIVNKALRGKLLAKLKGNDKFCTVSLLSSMDDDKDEEVRASEPSKPAPPRPAPRPRAASKAPATAREATPAHLVGTASPQKQQDVPTPMRIRGKTSLGGKPLKASPGSPARSTPERLERLSKGCVKTASVRLSIVKGKLRSFGRARRAVQTRTFSIPQWIEREAQQKRDVML